VVGPLALLQLALLQPRPLDTIREMLAAGDTVRAVALLKPQAEPGPTLDGRGLADLLLLQWIGRSPRQTAARQAWSAAGANVRKPAERSEAGRVFMAAVEVERGPPERALVRVLGGTSWRRRVSEIAQRAAQADPLLAGAARWVLVQDDLRRVREVIRKGIATVDELPVACRARTGAETVSCTLRAPPPPEARLGVLLDEDPSGVVPALAADLDSARAGPWPFDEMAAWVRVAAAAMRGDRAALAACAQDTAGLGGRAAAAVRVMAFEFGHQRDRAAEEMARHPDWYTGLDAELDALGWSPLAPALFWRLAQPLYLEPYNARQVAHRARLLLADVVRRTLPSSGGAFGEYGHPTMLVTSGVPVGLQLASLWARGTGGRRLVVGYLPASTHETVVRLDRGMAPAALDLALAARNEVASRASSGYVAEGYDRLTPFDHQVVQYVRDGHRMVDVYAERPVAAECPASDPKVAFFLLDRWLAVLREVADTAPRRQRYRFRMVLAPSTYVYSLELLDAPCRLAGRARYVLVVPPVDSTALSDLVLADNVLINESTRVTGEQPAIVRPSLRILAGATAHFYWEAYRLDTAGSGPARLDVHFEVVNVTRSRVGLGQLGGLEGAAARTKPLLDIRYGAPVPDGAGPVGMGLSVTLPEDAYGLYVARVTLRDQVTGREETAQRALFVERPVVELPGGRD
jgi:hypothetical protein